MKKLTFKNPLILGIIILAIGFICSTVSKMGVFTNAAWVLYRLLFVIHPVWPERIQRPKMALSIRLAGVAVVLLALITRFGV